MKKIYPMRVSAKTIGFVFILACLLGVVVFFLSSFTSKRSRCDMPDEVAVKNCWQEVVESSMKKGDIGGAFDSLVALYDANSAYGDTCHSLTHEIGKSAYLLFSRGRQFDVTPKTAYCSYGFYHGFMEALVNEKKDMKLARDFCSYVDEQISKVSPDVALQCYHGIGHGTVNNHDPRTWGNAQALIDPALSLCKEVSSSESERVRCGTGVFNGISIFYTSGEYELVLDQKDPLKICRQQKLEDQDACYISMNTLLLQLNNYNLSEAASYLSTISDDVMASHAMINLAAPISSRDMNKSDHTDAIHTCRSLPSRLRLPCIQGYAFGFLENGQPEREYVKSLGFCESKLLTTEERSSCFEYILSYLPKWYPEEKVVLICQQLAAKERARCEEVIQQ